MRKTDTSIPKRTPGRKARRSVRRGRSCASEGRRGGSTGRRHYGYGFGLKGAQVQPRSGDHGEHHKGEEGMLKPRSLLQRRVVGAERDWEVEGRARLFSW